MLGPTIAVLIPLRGTGGSRVTILYMVHTAKRNLPDLLYPIWTPVTPSRSPTSPARQRMLLIPPHQLSRLSLLPILRSFTTVVSQASNYCSSISQYDRQHVLQSPPSAKPPLAICRAASFPTGAAASPIKALGHFAILTLFPLRGA